MNIGILSCLCASLLAAETTQQIAKSWRDGKYASILKAAEGRLAANPNDLPALILVLGYQMEYLDLVHLNKTIDQVVALGSTVKTPHFSRLYARFRSQLQAIKLSANAYSKNDLERDRTKSGRVGKELPFAEELRALELDGFVAP